MSKKIGFIGGGMMAEGIIQGMIKNQNFKAEEIFVYDILGTRLDYLSEKYGIIACKDTESAVTNSDLIIFAVRPQDAEGVCGEIKPYLNKNTVFSTICAGVLTEKYSEWLGAEQKIVRVMPNTLTKTMHGYSAIYPNAVTKDSDLEILNQVLESIGQVIKIREDMFDAFTAYSCAGPAYILHFLSAMIDAGVRAGFSRKEARSLTLENLIGTSMKVTETNMHPLDVLDLMTSPAGVTIEAVYRMNKTGMYASVMDSVGVAVEKSKSLG